MGVPGHQCLHVSLCGQRERLAASGQVTAFGTMKPEQHGRHFADGISKVHVLEGKLFNSDSNFIGSCCHIQSAFYWMKIVEFLIKFNWNLLPRLKGPINYKPALVQIWLGGQQATSLQAIIRKRNGISRACAKVLDSLAKILAKLKKLQPKLAN